MSKKLEIDTLWYFPSNRWIFRNTKSKISSPIYIPIENKSSNIKRRIIINPGENTLQEDEYKHIVEHFSLPTLKPYFDEGSFVWGKDRKVNSFTSNVSTEKSTDIDGILSQISNASTAEQLEAILEKSKDNTVMLAVKERFNEINKANSQITTELN
jgi:hypothetical protein